MDVLQFIAQIAVPVLALVISGVSFYLTNRMNKKVNKKDYEISENLKYELMKLIAALRSMDSKAVLQAHFNHQISYSKEIEILANLHTSPCYLLLLHSIKNDDARMMMDVTMQILIINGHALGVKDIRVFTNRILDYIKNEIDLQKAFDIDVITLLNNFCTMRGTAPELTEKDKQPTEQEQEFRNFIKYLVEHGNSDPNVLMYYGLYINDHKVLEKALKSGANIKVKEIEIIKKYSQEYDAFRETKNQAK